MSKPLGIILYKGPSRIDGKKIIVIATGIFNKTANTKTGNMIQTWIFRCDMSPIPARRYGYDYSVCGDCKHRHLGSCYVNIAHGAHNVYNSYMNDRYIPFQIAHLSYFKDRKLRIGSFGDPAAVPTDIWANLCMVTNAHTGYTHHWNSYFTDPELKQYCMASCDNEDEYHKAKAKGWRCFRVRMSTNDVILDNEFICPASKEAGEKSDCSTCKACMGLNSTISKDICIIVHGLQSKIDKFRWGMTRIKNKKKYRKKFDYPVCR